MATQSARDEIGSLILRVGLRDRIAFDRLYAATAAKLFGTCLRVLKNRAEAEDALQEVFVKIWLKADRFAITGQSPMTWLIALTRNHAIDRLRSRREASGTLDDVALAVPDSKPDPEQQTQIAGENRQLANCLSELETDKADALRAAYMQGDSYADLASRYVVPLNTMRTWLRRGLMRLKECLER